MASSKKKKKSGKPPKIKLPATNGNGETKPDPKPAAGRGKETARIDLSAAKTDLDAAKTDLSAELSDVGATPPEDTTRIDLPKPPAKIRPKAKSETSKLDLASAHPADDKDDTSRITLPHKKSETARISLSEARPVSDAVSAGSDQHAETQPIDTPAEGKDDTFRIDLGDVDPESKDGEDFSPATSGIETPPEEAREEILKQSTMRVDLSESEAEESAPPAAPAASRNQTMRVELDDKSAAPRNETARMDVPDAGSESPTSVGTTRVPLDGEEGGEDVLKRRAAAAAPAPLDETVPDLIEDKKPPTPSKPASAVEMDPPEPTAAPRNQTARVAAPPEMEKSKTARIEVPAELAGPGAGRPKTIRIKRADSTSGPVQAPVPEPTVKRGSKGKKKKPTIMSDDVGTLYSSLALASLLIMGVVVYVLLAQTIDPSLPWIGKVSL